MINRVANDQAKDLWKQSKVIHRFQELNLTFEKFRDLISLFGTCIESITNE